MFTLDMASASPQAFLSKHKHKCTSKEREHVNLWTHEFQILIE